jgi:hypothetical protein
MFSRGGAGDIELSRCMVKTAMAADPGAKICC